MRIKNMTDEDDHDEYHFSVWNTVTDRFLTDPITGDQMWTIDIWRSDEVGFTDELKKRISNLLPTLCPDCKGRARTQVGTVEFECHKCNGTGVVE